MKAIRINAEEHSITLVDIDDSLPSLQKEVGGYIAEGWTEKDNILWVDDEGLLKSPKQFQAWPQKERIFAGNGIITGLTNGGDTKDTTMTIEEIEESVQFIGPTKAIELAKEWGI